MSNVAPTLAVFRADFPEFANTSIYSDATTNFYLGLAGNLLDVCRWGDNLSYGAELFVAHNLVLAAQRARSAAAGGIPATTAGPATSRTVDKVTISTDASVATLAGAGAFNLTSYGVQFMQLAGALAAGGLYMAVPEPTIDPWQASLYGGGYFG